MAVAENAHPDLLLRAHDLYRTLSSAADWELLQQQPVVDLPKYSLKLYRRRAPALAAAAHSSSSSFCYKAVAKVSDDKSSGIALRPRNFGAVLGEPSLQCKHSVFDQVEVKERFDARTSLQHLTFAAAGDGEVGGLHFRVINQTVATSTTFVSISTSVPDTATAVIPATAISSLRLLASVVERAADFDGLRVTVLLKLDDEKENAERLALRNIPRAILGAADQLRKRGFAPYLLNFAQRIVIRAEEYVYASTRYDLRWEVESAAEEGEVDGEEVETDVGEFDPLGRSTTSVFSTSSSSPIPMVEVRVDRIRWLNPKGGVAITLHENGEFHRDLGGLIEVTEDAEHGLRVSCLFHLNRQPGVFSMSLQPCDRPGIWFNDTNLHLTDQPISNAEIPEVRVAAATTELSSNSGSPARGGGGASAPVRMLGCATPGILLPLYPHRFLDDASKAFNFFNLLLADAASFRHVTTQKKNVAVYHKEVLDHPIGALKGVAVYPVCSTLAARALMWDTLAVLQTAGVRKIWDSQTFDYDTLLEHLSPTSFVVHAMNKAVWPTSARDATVINTLITSNQDRIQALVSSIDAVDPALPPVKQGVVRAHVDVAGWDIEHDSAAREVRVTHVIQFNPKGWIPSSIISAVSTQIPLAVDAVHAHLTRYGAPPYLVACCRGYRVTKAEYAHGSGTYQLAAMPREEGEQGEDLVPPGASAGDKKQENMLLVRIDLEKWCSGDLRIDASQEVALFRDDDSYGDNALVVGLAAAAGGSDIELRVAKGARGTGLFVNGVPCDVPGVVVDTNTIAQSHSAASLPISIPSPRAQSTPSGSPRIVNHHNSEGWESPAARLSTSVVMRKPSSGGARGGTQQQSLPLDGNGNNPAAAPRVFARQGFDTERTRELRHAADSALSKLLKVDGKSDNWVQVAELRSGLSIYKKTLSASSTSSSSSSSAAAAQPPAASVTAGSQFPIMKGVKVIEGFSAAEIFAVIKTFGCRRIWDDLFDSGRRLEYGGEGVDVSYITMPTLFPMTRRDLLVVHKHDLLGRYRSGGAGPQSIVSASSSVSETLLGETALSSIANEAAAGNVRAQLLMSGWILDAIDPYTTQHPIPSTKVTFYFQADLGGSVPTAMYGLMIGSAPKHPARVEAYLVEHGVPPYVAWPGLPAADAVVDSAMEFSTTATAFEGVVRVSREGFNHGKNIFSAEVLVPVHELVAVMRKSLATAPWRQARGPADPEMDASDALSDEESEEGLLLLMHVVVDLSRFAYGYDVSCTSKRVMASESGVSPATTDMGSASRADGPGLRVEVVEVPPPPTHLATHFPTAQDTGVAPGINNGGGNNEDSASVARSARNHQPKNADVTLTSPSRGKPKGVTKHTISVFFSKSAVTNYSDNEAVAGDDLGDICASLNIVPATKRTPGPSSDGGVGSTGRVSVNGAPTTVTRHQDAQHRASQRQRIRKRMSQLSSAGSTSRLSTGLAAIDLEATPSMAAATTPPLPQPSTPSTTTAQQYGFFGAMGLLGRRRPGGARAGGSEITQHAQRISSLPMSSGLSSSRKDVAENPPQKSLPHNLQQQRRTTSAAAALLTSDGFPSNPVSTQILPPRTDKGTHHEMETPPPLRGSDISAGRSTTNATPIKVASNNHRSGSFWTRFRTPGKEGTFPPSMLLVCGFLAFCVGFALQLFFIDPWVYPAARPPPARKWESPTAPLPPLDQNPSLPVPQCPQVFCPPCPVCPSLSPVPHPPPPPPVTVTITVTAAPSAASV
ncbi:hypothetical protein HDU86_006325 [Geranomyces michiganensis]|nr:hypothetical protein HDU86_006325 [Geranomyces michiganensis]